MTNKLKNIVFVYDFAFNNGGIYKVLYQDAEDFLREGYNVYFVSAGPEADLPDGVVHYSVGKSQRSGGRGLQQVVSSIWNLKCRKVVESLVSSLSVESTIVHFNGYSMALSGAIFNAFKDAGYKTVCSVHDFNYVCPNGVYYDFNRNAECDLKPMGVSCLLRNCDKRNYFEKIHRITRKAVDNSFVDLPNRADAVVYVSESLRTVFNSLGYREPRLWDCVIENPVPGVIGAVDKSNSFKYDLMFVGRVVEEKGIRMLCAVARKLGLSLVVLGGGALLEELKSEYLEFDFCGWVSVEDVRSYRSAAKIAVVPSLWCEASGLVVEEALAMRQPVIVPSRSGASDKVKRYSGLVVFERGSESDLEVALRGVCEEGVFSRLLESVDRDQKVIKNSKSEHRSALIKVYEGVLLSGEDC
ncbi:glycosyltransferase family 4 protein [Puniceicoccaceae bacterium K14]|nr:glycosyltransferase family 4 protein [Puniceicoccaceae bacterium K14]